MNMHSIVGRNVGGRSICGLINLVVLKYMVDT